MISLSFSDSVLEALRVYILWVYVAATIGVIFGVGLENEVFSKRAQHAGWLLLLFALGLETYLTIELFTVDSEIIHRQQRTIEQLLAHRKLSPAQKERIARVAKASPLIKFVTVTVSEAEPWDLVMEIAQELKSHGWEWTPCGNLAWGGSAKPLNDRPASCLSILDHIQINAPADSMSVARALADAIRDPSIIGMDDVRVENVDRPPMAIMVGSKR